MSERSIWIIIIIIGLLVLVGGYFLIGGFKKPSTTTPPVGPPYVPADVPNNQSPTSPSTAPSQTITKYPCETRKVCQAREGYANWVKTGTQKKCTASNVSQGLCIADCLGTCYTWE